MIMKQLVVLSLLLQMTVYYSSAHNGRPFRSIKAPIETVKNYAIVFPAVTLMDSNEMYPDILHVTLGSSVVTFQVVLEKNKLLVHPNFVSWYYDDNGNKAAVVEDQENCFYHGHVEDHPDWMVTMTTCHGLQGEFGDPSDENNFYHIEPLSRDNKSLHQTHALYLDKEYKMKDGGCGSNDSLVLNEDFENPPQSLNDHFIRRRQTANRLRFVELMVINDFRQYRNHKNDLTATVNRALAVVNGVDNLYKSLGIRISLVGSVTWTKGNKIQVVGDPYSLLKNFQAYKDQISGAHDAALLLTGRDLYGQTVGIAYTGTMCNDHTSVGVTQDNGRSVQSVATTAAHEIGHLFNMKHDDQDSGSRCICGDASGRCIMGSISMPPLPTRWSTCSVDSLNKAIKNWHLDSCLYNEPASTVGGSVCGNGIRDGDEVCDCGRPTECNDPCCDPRTCQFVRGADCSAAELCCTSGCKFKDYGSVCRDAVGECDIAEYCSGGSGECPSDEHKLDGISCKSDKGYCYSGRCPTHDEQCQLAYKSRKGDNRCYDTINTRGDIYGNCGSTPTAFVPCDENDVQCGQLHCTEGELQSSAYSSVSVSDLTFGIQYYTNSGLALTTCRSFTTRPGIDTMSPGLVKEGTKCGKGRVCNAQHCVPVSTSNPCGKGSNGKICSGNGTCSNHGKCSCAVGYEGSVCQQRSM